MEEISIKKMLENREKEFLSEKACLSSGTKGREFPVSPDDMRTEFQRDRDRIIHSKSFRRLMHKTQVFLSPEHDHYRTRLTHTLEVTQIARTIARSLRLNEDLAEAIGLGHDLGHTPFGHAGERTLQKCFEPGFTHMKQSLRVADKIEKLNLTCEVRDGIVNHAGDDMASTLEGVVVKFADRIAYINHDIDDACRAGILRIEDIPRELREILGETHAERINTMVSSVVKATAGCELDHIAMETGIQQATDALRNFLFERVYTNPTAKGEEVKADIMLAQLYEHFVSRPDELPPEFRETVETEGIPRAVADYISGMTDRYAINKFKKLFVPVVWAVGGEET